MSSQIDNPIRVFALITQVNGPDLKLPVTSLTVGKLTFSLLSIKSPEQELSLRAIEVHGELLEIGSPIEKLDDSCAVVSWSTFSFDFQLFHAWVAGLNILEKEAMVLNLMRWHEELQDLHQRSA